jgi:hypothetical protein
VLDKEAADVIGGATGRQLVECLMCQGVLLSEAGYHLCHVRLPHPGQSAVGSAHRTQGVDDDLQARIHCAGVDVCQELAGGVDEDAPLTYATAVEFGFGAATYAVDIESYPAAGSACWPIVDDPWQHALVPARADARSSLCGPVAAAAD